MKEYILDFFAYLGNNIYEFLYLWLLGATIYNFYVQGHQPSNLKLLIILMLFLKHLNKSKPQHNNDN